MSESRLIHVFDGDLPVTNGKTNPVQGVRINGQTYLIAMQGANVYNTLVNPTIVADASIVAGDFMHLWEFDMLSRKGGAAIINQISLFRKNNILAVDVVFEFYGDEPTIASAVGSALDIADDQKIKRCVATTIRAGSGSAATNNVAQEDITPIIVSNYEATIGTKIWAVMSSLDPVTINQGTDEWAVRLGAILL